MGIPILAEVGRQTSLAFTSSADMSLWQSLYLDALHKEYTPVDPALVPLYCELPYLLFHIQQGILAGRLRSNTTTAEAFLRCNAACCFEPRH